MRAELCAEAIRLGRLLARLMPDDAETAGPARAHAHPRRAARGPRRPATAATSRCPTRTARAGTPTALAEGRAQLDRALRLRRAGPYQLQAAIASLHCEDEVDWPQIAALYRRLACMAPSPVVEVNRAVALGMAGSPHAGLAILERVDLDRYQPFHVAHAELLRRSGDGDAADGAYARAIELSANAVERAELERPARIACARAIHVADRRRPVARPRCAWRAAPRHVVGAHPARALGLHRGDHGVGGGVVVAEAHEDLVEHDVVEDLDAVLGAEHLGEAPRARAAALDELGHAVAPERAQRGPDRERRARGARSRASSPSRRAASRVGR